MVQHSDEVKERARRAVHDAIIKGLLPRPSSCLYCGVVRPEGSSEPRLGYHHTDYSKPLNVEPVCPRCHSRIHVGAIVDGSGIPKHRTPRLPRALVRANRRAEVARNATAPLPVSWTPLHVDRPVSVTKSDLVGHTDAARKTHGWRFWHGVAEYRGKFATLRVKPGIGPKQWFWEIECRAVGHITIPPGTSTEDERSIRLLTAEQALRTHLTEALAALGGGR